MATYYDRLNDAFALFAKQPPASSTQLLLLHLLHLHNENMNCGSVQVTDRELISRTRLSKNTITEAKRTLKNLGLIDFKTDKHTPAKLTTYFFSEKVGQRVGQTLGQKVGQAGLVCYTQNAGAMDGGESFPQTPFKEDLRQEKKEDAGTRREQGDGELETVAGAIPLKSSFVNEFDELIEQWDESPCFCKLDFQLISELELLAKEHGVTTLLKAMEQAKHSQTKGVSLKYFLETLKYLTNEAGKPQTTKTQTTVKEFQASNESEESELFSFTKKDF